MKLLALALIVVLAASVAADDAPCHLFVGLPYPAAPDTFKGLAVPVTAEETLTCDAIELDCNKKNYPEGANYSVKQSIDDYCGLPNAKSYKSTLMCTGTNPNKEDELNECNVDAIAYVYAEALKKAKDSNVFSTSQGACVTDEIELAYQFKEPRHFELHGGLFNLNTMCEVDTEKKMQCYGPEQVDCDKIAIASANFQGWLAYVMGPLGDMDLLQKKYHIRNMLVWAILGSVFTWIGFLLFLYAEIKAVLTVRERDERDRLVEAKILKKNDVKMNELLETENGYFLIRPFITILAFLIFWGGMLFQFTPFCSFITLIFPFWFGLEHACYLIVLAATLFFAASLFLIVLGLIWSCTRGWAALVLLVLGLITNGLVFTGLIGLSIWAFLLVGLLLLYFKFLPDYYAEKSEKPDWVQNLGAFTFPTTADDFKKFGEGAANTLQGDLRKIPGVAAAQDKAEELTREAQAKMKEAQEFAEQKAKEAREYAEQQAKEAQAKMGGAGAAEVEKPAA
eukprot:CAMPEP_0113677732 /NCGR_PEP_ID=MMETSP0038_2-20120614/9461_1 /TAXON_ID=2898 /ORGANISM="Cryptomonas paramecium" /LENGTH=508 /DNA_ID=CAMNT_0000595103 /DNA_START=29 /DNA_END=1555 /DNA_ORIENTATION=- /assembly_acc=CAM_ASM_000170